MQVTAAAAPEAHASRDGAAARLCVEYRERIYRFCLSRLRSREEAEDAVQNVFLRVHTALDRGVVPEFESAWLYKIAHNVCLSRAESSARRTKHEALSAFDDDELPFAALEVSREELAGLSEALEAMPHNLRTALLLREWQGLSYAEIADAMGLSVSAVETLLFRARRHLANALEHGTDRKKSVVLRALDLLGLGWLRDVLMGAGPAAQLAAGAAVLAVGGGGAAIAMTTDAHSRPAPAPPIVSVTTPASSAQPVHFTTASQPASVKVGRAAAKELTRVTRALGIPLPVLSQHTQPRVSGTTTTTVATAPSTVAQSPAPSLSTTTPLLTVSTPTTVDVSTVSEPTVSVPTVSVPTVSVPSVTVPAVSLPDATGGVVGGK
ncbi:MAG TPA: sigma-70 family RNA polymerase sigma factor [Gaiellaceae bacterium]|nr:sigma-70 family RNA polymerase sigma factor [Gaiellaceae bacterium]